MTKTIILDLGNVILTVDFNRCHQALAGVCSHPIADIPRRIRSTGLVERFETGEASPEVFYREVSGVLGMNAGYGEFWDIWSSIFAPEPIIPESMLEGLGRERRLVLLSNTNAMHLATIRAKHPRLLGHFDSLVLSYEVGALKPDPRIYQEAIARAGCRPEECFFTDDMAPFVEGARQQGIDAVQFQSLDQLERELRARDISW